MDGPHFRHILVDEKNKILFEITRKCGTTVGTLLFFDHLGIKKESEEYGSPVQYFLDVYKPTVRQDLDILNDPEYYKIKIVRNPYSRLVSSFLQFGKSEIIPNTDTFVDFVHMLETTDLNLWDSHIYPQFKDGETKFTFNKIIKIEKLKEGLDEVNSEIFSNFKLPIHEYLYVHHIVEDYSVNKNCWEIPYKELSGTKVPHYKNFYNEEIKERVFKIYQKDLLMYNYTFEEFECFEKESINIYK